MAVCVKRACPEIHSRAGLPEYELKAGGNEIDVTASNAGEYVAAVVEATLSKGIKRQMDAFRSES